MALLPLKLMLTPVLICLCVLVGRRWGRRAGGLVMGLPLVSGPISVLLFLEHGERFAVSAAHGTLVGFVAGGAFCAAYAELSNRWSWHRALAGALVTFAATAWVILPLELDWTRSGLLVLGTLALFARSLRTLNAAEPGRQMPAPRKRDVATQVALATAIVFALTTWAGELGSQLAGLLATLPAVSLVMATTSLRAEGPGAANEMLRGAVIGSWGGAAFFAVAGGMFAVAGPVGAYGTATVAALATGLVGARLHV